MASVFHLFPFTNSPKLARHAAFRLIASEFIFLQALIPISATK